MDALLAAGIWIAFRKMLTLLTRHQSVTVEGGEGGDGLGPEGDGRTGDYCPPTDEELKGLCEPNARIVASRGEVTE